MPENYGYGWEKLHLAVHSLCGAGSQKDRLTCAIVVLSILCTHSNQEHLPKDIQAEFETLYKKMTSVKAIGNEGSIVATINTLDEIEVSGAVKEIIGLYDSVCRYQEPF